MVVFESKLWLRSITILLSLPQPVKVKTDEEMSDTAPSSVGPLEISDDDTPWRSMAVRSSEESSMGFLKSKRGLTILVSVFVVFTVGVFAVFDRKIAIKKYHLTGNGNDADDDEELVAPLYGQSYLTVDEFRDVRTARPQESVLVTGGLGFIGSHVVDLLLHRGFKVTILDDESNGHNHNRFAKEMVPHDITIVGDLPEFPSGDDKEEDVEYYTHVIHLAAAISVAESMSKPEKYEKINFGGSRKVMDWINDYNEHISSLGLSSSPGPIRMLVAASSAAIYGDPDPSLLPLGESAPYGGLSPYADTKYRMEGLMQDFVSEQNKNRNVLSARSMPPTSAVALRFFNVYGPRQDPKNPYSGVISLFLEAALNGQDITVLGDGEMTRDFVYVKDVARAIVLALLQEEKESSSSRADATFDVFNVCTGESITINTLALQVKESMESHSDIVHLDPREGDIRESSCNPNGANRSIGFASAVSQKDGLSKTAAWFKSDDGSKKVKDLRVV